MLRQALDAASGPENEKHDIAETDPLLTRSQVSKYSTDINALEEIETKSLQDDDDVIEDEIIRPWHFDNFSDSSEKGFVEKGWDTLRDIVTLVVNVDNLWDSPSVRYPSRRSKMIVLFWFFILACSYALERTTFKIIVDRAGPFRLFSVEVVAGCHALMIAIGMILSAISRRDFTMQKLGVPIIDVGLMALLDTIHMILVFVTGLHVSPTLTVILVQFTLPLTGLITQFVHHDGCVKHCCRSNSSDTAPGSQLRGWGGLSTEHVLGSIIIVFAVLLSLTPAIYSIWDPSFFLYADTIPIQTAYNTLLFASSCVPAAASQLYKEHIFLQYKQPVQADYLNLILSIFQLIFASIMSPLMYTLQGLAATKDWPKLYPSSGISRNIMEGFQCFFGSLDEGLASDGYEESATCEYTLGFVFAHGFSIIAVGIAVDKIVNAGATKVMYRGVSAGIILSSIILYVYDESIPDFNYGSAIDSLNLVCVLLLIIGAEVYHRRSLQDATFETVYLPVDDFYDGE